MTATPTAFWFDQTQNQSCARLKMPAVLSDLVPALVDRSITQPMMAAAYSSQITITSSIVIDQYAGPVVPMRGEFVLVKQGWRPDPSPNNMRAKVPALFDPQDAAIAWSPRVIQRAFSYFNNFDVPQTVRKTPALFDPKDSAISWDPRVIPRVFSFFNNFDAPPQTRQRAPSLFDPRDAAIAWDPQRISAARPLTSSIFDSDANVLRAKAPSRIDPSDSVIAWEPQRISAALSAAFFDTDTSRITNNRKMPQSNVSFVFAIPAPEMFFESVENNTLPIKIKLPADQAFAQVPPVFIPAATPSAWWFDLSQNWNGTVVNIKAAIQDLVPMEVNRAIAPPVPCAAAFSSIVVMERALIYDVTVYPLRPFAATTPTPSALFFEPAQNNATAGISRPAVQTDIVPALIESPMRGEFAVSRVSQWIGDLSNAKTAGISTPAAQSALAPALIEFRPPAGTATPSIMWFESIENNLSAGISRGAVQNDLPPALIEFPQRGEFVRNFLSQWIGDLTNWITKAISPTAVRTDLEPAFIEFPMRGEFLRTFVAQWIGDLSNARTAGISMSSVQSDLVLALIESRMPSFASLEWRGDLTNWKRQLKPPMRPDDSAPVLRAIAPPPVPTPNTWWGPIDNPVRGRFPALFDPRDSGISWLPQPIVFVPSVTIIAKPGKSGTFGPPTLSGTDDKTRLSGEVEV